MKKNTKKIPILSAAAFIALMTAGCAQFADEAETGAAAFIPESTSKQVQSTAETTAETTTAVTETETTTKKTKQETKTSTSAKKKKKKKKTTTTAAEEPAASEESAYTGLLKSPEDLEIYDTDGAGWDYEFVYDGKIYEAIYTAEPENWKIIDSYKITDRSDMTIICGALCGFHPIHGSDYVTFRTPEDMAYEWEQHNLAYKLLPDSNPWKENARDVDLDPEDQGKGLYELFKSRTGGDILPAG